LPQNVLFFPVRSIKSKTLILTIKKIFTHLCEFIPQKGNASIHVCESIPQKGNASTHVCESIPQKGNASTHVCESIPQKEMRLHTCVSPFLKRKCIYTRVWVHSSKGKCIYTRVWVHSSKGKCIRTHVQAILWFAKRVFSVHELKFVQACRKFWLNLVETLFGKMSRTFLKQIRVTLKAELKERILKGYRRNKCWTCGS